MAANKRDIILYPVVLVALASVVSWLVYAGPLSTAAPATPRPAALPPGWAVGVIWVGLFALLGVALARVPAHSPAFSLLIMLIAYCLLYPFLTRARPDWARSLDAGAAGLAAFTLVALAASGYHAAAACVVPVTTWATYVAVAL